MKKFLSIILLGFTIGAAMPAHAQSNITGPLYLHDARVGTLQEPSVAKYAKSVARDSVNSSTTVLVPTTSYAYWNYDSIALGNYRSASILVFITRASGTLAGTIRLEGSVDGNTWNQITDTATISNAATYSFTWELPGKQRTSAGGTLNGLKVQMAPPAVMPYLYYRVYIAGTGTWCGTFYSAIEPRQ